GHSPDRFGIAHGVAPCGHRDMRKLSIGGAVLVHMAALDHGVTPNGREAPRVFHILGDGGDTYASLSCSADGTSVRGRRRTIGHDCALALAGTNHGTGMVVLKFRRRPPNVCRVNPPGIKTKIFRTAHPSDALIPAGVVDRIDILPGQA